MRRFFGTTGFPRVILLAVTVESELIFYGKKILSFIMQIIFLSYWVHLLRLEELKIVNKMGDPTHFYNWNYFMMKQLNAIAGFRAAFCIRDFIGGCFFLQPDRWGWRASPLISSCECDLFQNGWFAVTVPVARSPSRLMVGLCRAISARAASSSLPGVHHQVTTHQSNYPRPKSFYFFLSLSLTRFFLVSDPLSRANSVELELVSRSITVHREIEDSDQSYFSLTFPHSVIYLKTYFVLVCGIAYFH